MKGSMLWKVMYVFCALAGCLAGYGIFSLTGNDEIKQNTITKDNTLVRDAEDSVFFHGEEVTVVPALTVAPTATPELQEIVESQVASLPEKKEVPVMSPIPEPVATPVEKQGEPTGFPLDKLESEADEMPTLASQWASAGVAVPTVPVMPPANVTTSPEQTEQMQNPVEETLTYPAEIFGQVPVINRSDAYVSYFEFAYDLIAMLEPEVNARGMNLNSLLAKFVIKALFCGVDIEKLDINAPIPRRLAALCLWLAAQILREEGSDTSAKSAQKYVMDLGGCSSAEKKSVAYLYEQGILEGYQTSGQMFYPDAGLTTESGSTWLSRVKQCWK